MRRGDYDALVRTLRRGAANTLIGLATALAIVAVALPLFLNPMWVAFEQGRAEAIAWTGFAEPELRAATDAILADLVFGPPEFDVAIAGDPVLNARERGHMRDVRGVFTGFFAATLVLGTAAFAVAARRRGADRVQTWRSVRGGALALTGALAIGGIVSLVAFEALFEVFHRIFFAGGTYTFDPATERLVQLFPFRFWLETAVAVGTVCMVVAGLVVVATRGRAAGASSASAAAATATAVDTDADAVADPAAPTLRASGPSR
jgi:integral membrane protein (TIGR01906 family)